MPRVSAAATDDDQAESAAFLSAAPSAFITTTGNLSIDGLSGPAKWGTAQGQPATVTFSFAETSSTFIEGYAEPRNGFAPLSQGQREAVRAALATWEQVGNVQFVEVKETAAKEGDIRFGVSALPETADTRYPGPYTSAGDVWLGSTDHRPDADLSAERAKYAPGGYDYWVLVHEIGHALGAKHPHETQGRNTVLPATEDWRGASVMSYRDAPSDRVDDGTSSSIYPHAPMDLDVDWVRSIYGAASRSNVGDTTYKWAKGQALFETIVDDSGNDTLDWSNQTSAVKFDLKGGWQEAGPAYRWDKGSLATTLFVHGKDAIENAYGGSGDDRIAGNDRANHLVGNGGDDRLEGRGGVDLLEGGAGNDVYVIDPGAGLDTIIDTGGAMDRIEFAKGFHFADLQFSTTAGDLRIQSDDTKTPLDLLLVDQFGKATIDDLLFTSDQSEFHWDGRSFGSAPPVSGNVPTEQGELLILTDGDDRVFALGGNDVVYGKAGADFIDGGNGNDWLIGGTGDDHLVGANGNDKLDGGDGKDLLEGGNDADILRGGGGNDTLQAGNEADIAYGAVGDDLIYGGEGDDSRLVGGVGDDTVYGGAGRDSLDGASGDDILDGGDGNDLIVGGAGADMLNGASGNDVLRGGFGDDRLEGGEGNDELNGGFGNDRLYGGPGKDTAIFNGSILQYHITDVGGGVTEVRHIPANGIWYGADRLSEVEFLKFGNAPPVPVG